jgi:hypothetical protein
MGSSCPYSKPYLSSLSLILLCQLFVHVIHAQQIPAPRFDSTRLLKGIRLSRPALQFTDGYVSYNGNYRSNIDTPYAEKNILQHNITGQLNVQVATLLPLQVRFWARESNSSLFRDLADVQVSFNGPAFRNQVQAALRDRLLALQHGLKDSLLEKAHALAQNRYTRMADSLRNFFHPQKLTEAYEVLRVPGITDDKRLPDSTNRQRADSLKKKAAVFIDQYQAMQQRYQQLEQKVDSLQKLYNKNRERVNQFKQLVNGNWNDLKSPRLWKEKLQEYGLGDVELPGWYRWLAGLRSFSIGRSPVNYSELTAKNISVNGINFEYNSWYYLAVTAGTVNYRFRDFAIPGARKVPQHVYMVRAGLGMLEKNYFILSYWGGRKQAGNTTIPVTGFGMETKWALHRTTWLKAEVAQSVTPDIYSRPLQSGKFSLRDRTSQAIALHLYSFLPVTGSRIEAFYRQSGARFQSFNSYQTNNAQQSWYVKAEQGFFKQQVRLSASLRKNEYSNPLIVQNYNTNTLFKSASAAIRIRRWPMLTIGYQPMSQYTKAGNEVVENRFQTMNANLYHGYAIKQLRMATTMMLNRFYNTSRDTGFVYYNAMNSYFMQNFFFAAFTANVGASFTKNDNYLLQVLDGYVEPNTWKWGSAGLGIKLHNMNRAIVKAGGYVNGNVRIGEHNIIYITYEHGYLPGIGGHLVQSDMGTLHYTRTFNFK